MLDKKLKEQIYYGNNQPKKEFNNKAFYILVAVIVGFALIVALISINSNSNTHYEQPTQKRALEDIVGEKPVENIEPQTEPEQKTYTETEIQTDIKSYKTKFIAKVKQNWHPNEESFLIDNDSLQVKIDKNGNVTFPEFEKIGFSNANADIMKYTVQDGMPYDSLPDSYNNETLTFRIYFEGNTDSYWGNAEAKSSYQVSLSPIKQTYKQPSTQSKPQSNSLNKETSPKTEIPVDNIKYKVVVGTYTTKEQAALARKIIVGNDKTSTDALYSKLKENSYPVRIIEEK